MARSKKDITATLLDEFGTTFADEVGIRLEDRPAALFQWLVASTLMSARISATISVRSARELFERGWTTVDDMMDTTWDERVEALNAGGYTRYQERTATMLGDTAAFLEQRHGGDLRNVRDEAGHDPRRERALLKEVKGIGDVGVDIFFREAQAVWDELRPFADAAALDAAAKLDLGSDPGDLDDLVGQDDLPRLLAALVRVDLDDRYDEVRRGQVGAAEDGDDLEGLTKDELYERAQEQDVEGRSQMSKDELVDALGT